VNLESHRVVDLLPDRKAETAAAWMRQQPDLMVVSRDRGGEYASAAAQGAPQATQCADRFHLLKNLREAVEGLLAHHLAAHCQRQTQATLEALPKGGASSPSPARGASGPLRAGDRLT
jgi:transposase